MKLFFFALTVVLLAPKASAGSVEYKHWTNFESDYGYSFSYPACWKLSINDPDEEGDFHQIRNLEVVEGSCKTRQLDPYIGNGFGFSAFLNKTDKVEREKAIAAIKKSIPFQLKNGSYLVSKTGSVDGGGEIITYVESFGKPGLDIRWIAKLFCPERQLSLTFASTKDPSKELLQKLKKGDLAIPEPYKTVFESVKCTKDKK